MVNSAKTMAVVVLAMSSVQFAQAGEIVTDGKVSTATGSVNVGSKRIEITGRLGAGYLTGESKELVYEDGKKVSQLDWELKDILTITGGMSVQPYPWLKLNADLYVAVTEGNGAMDDYDWLGESDSWTHWSHSYTSLLDQGVMYDLNAEVQFYKTNPGQQSTTLSLFIGFKADNWRWHDQGQTDYIYSSSGGFRDLVWTEYSQNPGITYEQWWYVPYAGLGIRSVVGLWDIAGRVYGSPFVQGNDKDYHHLRNLIFEDDFEQSAMFGADLAVKYLISNNWGIAGAVQYQHYDKAKGSTTMTDTITGEQAFFDGDAAGGDNELLLLTLTLCYQF